MILSFVSVCVIASGANDIRYIGLSCGEQTRQERFDHHHHGEENFGFAKD